MTRHPHGETVTRQRGVPATDPYSGEETGLDWSSPVELSVPRCAVDPSKTRETFDTNRNAVVTDYVLWTDGVYDITAADRLVVRGVTCEIVGKPAIWGPNPFTGDVPGMEIFANVWEG